MSRSNWAATGQSLWTGHHLVLHAEYGRAAEKFYYMKKPQPCWVCVCVCLLALCPVHKRLHPHETLRSLRVQFDIRVKTLTELNKAEVQWTSGLGGGEGWGWGDGQQLMIVCIGQAYKHTKAWGAATSLIGDFQLVLKVHYYEQS